MMHDPSRRPVVGEAWKCLKRIRCGGRMMEPGDVIIILRVAPINPSYPGVFGLTIAYGDRIWDVYTSCADWEPLYG